MFYQTELFSFVLKKNIMFQYIKELKNRLLVVVSSWVINFIISYHYKEILLFFMVKNLSLQPFYFITTSITDIVLSYFSLSYFTASIFSSIMLGYHLIYFLTPSLYFSEFSFTKFYISSSVIIIFFVFFILNLYIVPYIWHFFLSFQSSQNSITLYFEGKLNEYIEFYIKFCVFSLFLTQTILFLLFLSSKIKNFTLFIKNYRKVIYVCFLLISTFLTPPDIFSQLLTFFLSQCFYEVSVLFVCYFKIINLEAS